MSTIYRQALKAIGGQVLICFFLFVFYVPVAFAESREPLPQKDPGYFSKGERFWSLMAGRSEDEMELGSIKLTQLTISDYVFDNFAVTYGIGLGYANARKTKNGFQGGPQLGLRMHFINCRRWSIYIDGSLGAVYHQYPMEEGTLHFNFDVQAGFGASYRINEKTALRGGYRHHHLSNAGIGGDEKNLGYDAPMFYFGVMRLF